MLAVLKALVIMMMMHNAVFSINFGIKKALSITV